MLKQSRPLMWAACVILGCGPAPIEIVRPVTVRPVQVPEVVAPPVLAIADFNPLNYLPKDTLGIVQVNGDNFRQSPQVQSIVTALKNAGANNPHAVQALADAEALFLNTLSITVGVPQRESNMTIVVTGNYDIDQAERLWKVLIPEARREIRPDGLTNFHLEEMLLQQIDATHWMFTKHKHKDRLLAQSPPPVLTGFPATYDSQTSIRGWMFANHKEFYRMMRALKLDEKELAVVKSWDVRLDLHASGNSAAHIDFRFDCNTSDEAMRLKDLMVSKNSTPPLGMFAAPPRYGLEGATAIITVDVSTSEADMVATGISEELIREFQLDGPKHLPQPVGSAAP